MLLGPALASLIAYQAAVALFPLGTTLGGIWYGFFPVAASPGLIAGTTGTVMAAGAIVAAFSGIIADPLQRRLGLHRRRLLRLIDALERQFSGKRRNWICRARSLRGAAVHARGVALQRLPAGEALGAR
jgi:hypothetical protein